MSIGGVNSGATSHSQASEKLKMSPLNEVKAEKLFSLYAKFFERFTKENSEIAQGVQWMKEGFNSVKECQFQWRDLDVTLSEEEIGKTLEKTGVLQLRPIDKDSRILIVGCGNKPLADSGGFPITEPEDIQYQNEHTHHNAVTIDPHLAANPTLVAFFGAQKLPMIENGHFDLIVIEGVSICDTPIGREELQRVLSPHGRVVVSQDSIKGYEFSWENNKADMRHSQYITPPLIINDLRIYEAFKTPH